MHTAFSWENLKEREHLEDTGVYGRIDNIKTDFQGVAWEYGPYRTGSG